MRSNGFQTAAPMSAMRNRRLRHSQCCGITPLTPAPHPRALHCLRLSGGGREEAGAPAQSHARIHPATYPHPIHLRATILPQVLAIGTPSQAIPRRSRAFSVFSYSFGDRKRAAAPAASPAMAAAAGPVPVSDPKQVRSTWPNQPLPNPRLSTNHEPTPYRTALHRTVPTRSLRATAVRGLLPEWRHGRGC
jgi:hypothetical protein